VVATSSPTFTGLAISGITNGVLSTNNLGQVVATSSPTFTGLVVNGNADVTGGALVEISNSSSDFGSSMRSMDVSGNYLYTVTYSDPTDSVLKIMDITDPTKPVELNSGVIDNLPNPVSGGGGKGIDLQGNYAYLAINSLTVSTDCLRIVDIQNPKTPFVVGGYNMDTGTAKGCNTIDVSGRYAYIGSDSDSDSLIIVDIADPYNPRIVNDEVLAWAESIWSVRFYNGYLYVLSKGETSNYDHFRIYDVKDPTNPVIVGGDSIDTGEGGWSMDISGSHLYIASGGNFTSSTTPDKLVIINISDPLNAYKEGGIHLADDSFNYLKVYGETVFISDWNGHIYQVDVASSTNPTLINSTYTGHATIAHAMINNYLYVGFADIPYVDTTLKTYSVSGIKSLSGNFGSLTSGKLYVKDELTVDKRLRVLDGISVGEGGIYSSGAIISSVTSTPNYFAGALGIGTTTPTSKLDVYSASSTGILAQFYNDAGGIIQFFANKITNFYNTLFVDGNTNRVGIATTTPEHALTVDGTAWATTLRQENNWHVFGGFQATTTVVALTQNIWATTTNASNSLWSGDEANGFTLSNDVMTIANSGDYAGSVSMTFSGSNAQEYLFRIYNLTKAEQMGYYQGTSGASASNYVNINMPIYLEGINAGDQLILQIENISSNDDITLRHGMFYISYLHD
jgi:hypothetical protein